MSNQTGRKESIEEGRDEDVSTLGRLPARRPNGDKLRVVWATKSREQQKSVKLQRNHLSTTALELELIHKICSKHRGFHRTIHGLSLTLELEHLDAIGRQVKQRDPKLLLLMAEILHQFISSLSHYL